MLVIVLTTIDNNKTSSLNILTTINNSPNSVGPSIVSDGKESASATDQSSVKSTTTNKTNEPTPLDEQKLAPYTWGCPSCTTINKYTSSRCKECNEKNPKFVKEDNDDYKEDNNNSDYEEDKEEKVIQCAVLQESFVDHLMNHLVDSLLRARDARNLYTTIVLRVPIEIIIALCAAHQMSSMEQERRK